MNCRPTVAWCPTVDRSVAGNRRQTRSRQTGPAGFYLVFRNRMAAAGRTNLLEALAARRPSSAPPSEHLQNLPACANASAAVSSREIGFAPEMTQRAARSCRDFLLSSWRASTGGP
jgi:hypothetical protein